MGSLRTQGNIMHALLMRGKNTPKKTQRHLFCLGKNVEY